MAKYQWYTGLSFARIAEVAPRMVGKYESREKDINHAQADVLGRLAVALHVDVSDLYERDKTKRMKNRETPGRSADMILV